MNVKRTLLLFSLLLAIPAGQLFSQNVENVDFFVRDQMVVVSFDITDYSTRYLYDVDLRFEGPRPINPMSISGNKNLTGGPNKEIVWNVFSDVTSFSGKFKAIVTITGKSKLPAGSDAAMLSIVPGLGDFFVKQGSARGLPVFLGVTGSLAAGEYFRQSALQNYTDYENAMESNTRDDTFKNYRTQSIIAQACLAAGITLWITDFIYVIRQGNRNEANSPYNQQEQHVKLHVKPAAEGLQLGLTYRFH